MVEASPILARFVVLELHGQKQFTFLIASEPGQLGEPWRLVDGRRVESVREAVIAHTLAEQHDIKLGESLEINGEPFKLVGLSGDTRSWMASFIFISPDSVARLFNSQSLISHVLVRSSNPNQTARQIERQTGLTAIPAPTLAANDRALLTGIIGAPLNLMVVVAFLASTIIVALTVYSAIVDRIREYGIARAMGARASLLFRVVLGQTFIIAGLGTVAGIAVYQAAWRLVASFRPQFWVRLTPDTMIAVIGSAAGMALLAALIPTRRVARLDPASVYRG